MTRNARRLAHAALPALALWLGGTAPTLAQDGVIRVGITFRMVVENGLKYGQMANPIFFPGPVEPQYSTFLSFIGFSVENDQQYYMDATVAYRRACLNAIEYLKKFGYSGEQAYLLLGSAPVEGRISGIVDIPNSCCTLYLPTEIFDFDVRPSSEGPTMASRGSAAKTS